MDMLCLQCEQAAEGTGCTQYGVCGKGPQTVALASAFGCGVNGLPLSLVLSWYEQKAVAILLTLLHLGITDIRLGPSLPAFVTPEVLDVLVEKFDIKPITTAKEDMAAALGGREKTGLPPAKIVDRAVKKNVTKPVRHPIHPESLSA